jgi:hypothetical protein
MPAAARASIAPLGLADFTMGGMNITNVIKSLSFAMFRS